MDAVPVESPPREGLAKTREAERPRIKNSSPFQRPPTESASLVDHGTRYFIVARVQALSLHTLGFTTAEIHKIARVLPRQTNRIAKKAKSRGFVDKQTPLQYVEDGFHPGRPKEITLEKAQEVVASVKIDRASREKSTKVHAYEYSISASSILRILRKHNLSPEKSTRKAGLNLMQRARRFKWCLAHKDWALEDWKKVIRSDESSVILGQRRGCQRNWRDASEAFEKSVVRNRWKGFSEFLFWGSFSYDKKGPFHIWKHETAKEKAAAQAEIDTLNSALEPTMSQQWEMNTGIERLGLRNRPGRKPQWNFKKETGKLVREGRKGRIDWYRYWKLIVAPKMIPFARECERDCPGTLVQEENAPGYAHHYIPTIYSLAGVQRLLWPGNSPDLTAIEKAWPWLKRRTTFLTKASMATAWSKAWREMPQEKIQEWIEGVMANVQKVIALKGGNEYKEGRDSKRAYKGRRKIEELFKHSWVRDDAPIDDEYEDIKDDGLEDQEDDE